MNQVIFHQLLSKDDFLSKKLNRFLSNDIWKIQTLSFSIFGTSDILENIFLNKTEYAVQSYAAGKTTLEAMLRMKILSNESGITEYYIC